MKPTGDLKPFDITISDPVARIQKYIDSYQQDASYKGFEAVLMRNIRILSATPPPPPPPPPSSPHSPEQPITEATFIIKVVPELCNPINMMHGGAIALLADMATTMAAAPAAEKGFWEFGGVSRTLSVTYVKPVLMGSTARVVCTLISVGARQALLKCVVRDHGSGELLAVAEHDKRALGAQVRVVKI